MPLAVALAEADAEAVAKPALPPTLNTQPPLPRRHVGEPQYDKGKKTRERANKTCGVTRIRVVGQHKFRVKRPAFVSLRVGAPT